MADEKITRVPVEAKDTELRVAKLMAELDTLSDPAHNRFKDDPLIVVKRRPDPTSNDTLTSQGFDISIKQTGGDLQIKLQDYPHNIAAWPIPVLSAAIVKENQSKPIGIIYKEGNSYYCEGDPYVLSVVEAILNPRIEALLNKK